MMKIITPVVLCGGHGTRLWPLSRRNYPKQFIDLNDEPTLFQKTINRLQLLHSKVFKINEILIVTNERYRYIVLQQLEEININIEFRIILEPISLNTAPSLTLASLATEDTNLVVLPSDHHIKSDAVFKNTIYKALEYLKSNSIFLLGVKPKKAVSSYGYVTYSGNKTVKKVMGFTEKPDSNLADKIIKDGSVMWNVGIFILKSKTWLHAISLTDKVMFKIIKKSWASKTTDGFFVRPHRLTFSKSPSNSIDYTVMEKGLSINLDMKLIELKTEWSDLGELNSLEAIYKKNKKNNIFYGNVVEKDTKNSTVITTDKNISLLGVKDLIIINTKDTLLVIDKKSSSSLKDLMEKLEKTNENILVEHSTVHRPWGKYEIILDEKNNKIKKITVKPKSELSYQSHKFRNEHWIVLNGTATVKKNGNVYKIRKNESTFIAKGEKHRLINDEEKDLEIIEVQTGTKISEEDIIRYEDTYGRK